MKPIYIIPLASCLWILASSISHAIVDVNNNSLSDLWEKHYNSGALLTNPDPQADPDGDGWTNAQEAAAGTHPFDANPPGGFLQPDFLHSPETWSDWDGDEILEHTPEAIILTWETIPGKQYTLLTSPDLTAESWTAVGPPIIGNGNTIENGFPGTESQNPRPDKLFWRVAVTESGLDSDSDGLNNYEEHLLGTNPVTPDNDGDTLSDYAEILAGTNPFNPDEDGDGLTDPFELGAGTSSSEQDSDGDAIPDSIDGNPLISAQSFSDADGDGIPDGDDPDPDHPRGPAPAITSENASGNPLADVTNSEVSRFVLTINNPAGPTAPAATDITLFLNGTQEPATITPLSTSSNTPGTQRFLLSWTAKITTGYPDQTLQNISLRFRDSQNATTWLNLARIDVAEWEGKIITLPFVSSEEWWTYDMLTHFNGSKQKTNFVTKNWGQEIVYRGPKTMKITGLNGVTSDLQLPDLTIPFLKISGSAGGSPSVVEQLDYAPIAGEFEAGFVFNNASNRPLRFELAQAGVYVTLNPGESKLEKINHNGTNLPTNTSAAISYFKDAEWKPFFSSMWPIPSKPDARTRFMPSINVFTTQTGHLKLHGVSNYLRREATITPHTSGTLEYPGLPQDSGTSEYEYKLMPISSEEWRKIVIKVYPPQQNFTCTKGYRLNFGTGTQGDAPAQTGWTMLTESGGNHTPLDLPANGQIEILAPSSELYQQITSPQGLVLFLKRDTSVNESHILSIDALPKMAEHNPVRLGSLNILPMKFKKMWETPNKANQVLVEARRDDPAYPSQQPDVEENSYGTPRNMLYITADPADGNYHVSIDIEIGIGIGKRDQFVCAAYKSGTKISNTDKALPALDSQPADMLIPATGSNQSGEQFIIKVAYDRNKNGLIDRDESPVDLIAAKSETGVPLPAAVRGFSLAAVNVANATIEGQATGSGLNWLGNFVVPNAMAMLRLFYDGQTGNMGSGYLPTTILNSESLDAFGSPGDFNEWLTHHTGANFNTEGVTKVQHYYWNSSKEISRLIVNASPLSQLKYNGTLTTEMEDTTSATVESFKQTSVPLGQSQTFPASGSGHNLQPILAALGSPHKSPGWVPTQTLLVGNPDGYDIPDVKKIPDDAFGTVGRSRFVNGEYRFVVKKEQRMPEPTPGDPVIVLPYTAIVVYLRVSGTSRDLYDFNHQSGGLSIPAAITQLGYGNGSYGRTNGIIYRATVDILHDYEMKVIRVF